MAIALVSSANTITTSSAIDTTGATLLVALISKYDAQSSTPPTDSKSNTWTALTSYWAGALNETECRLYYVANPTVGTGHTFTCPSGNQPALVVAAFSGVSTVSPVDQQNGFGPANASTIQPGSVTPAEDDELVVSGCAQYSSASMSASGMTVANTVPDNGGVNIGTAMAYVVQTTATAINPTWSTGFSRCKAVIASFKAAAGGGGGGNPWYYYAQQ